MKLKLCLRFTNKKHLRCGILFELAKKEHQLIQLKEELNHPILWNDFEKSQCLIQQIKYLTAIIEPSHKLKLLFEELQLSIDLTNENITFLSETESLIQRIITLYHKLELQTLFNGIEDHNNCYLKIQAGAGGTEAQDWAAILARMYLRYCLRKNLKSEIIEEQEGELAGLKSITFFIQGDLAYGLLKNERGVHRLVRPSPFDSNLKRHTSFSSIDVFPEIIKIQLKIDWKKDVREDTYRSGGKGGQHVNKTESAIRLVHLPTGIISQCQSGRSQHQNRETARKQLIAKIGQFEKSKQDLKLKALYGEKGEIAWGNQIRSYVLDDSRVKDLRTGHEDRNPEKVLDGDLDLFIEKNLQREMK